MRTIRLRRPAAQAEVVRATCTLPSHARLGDLSAYTSDGVPLPSQFRTLARLDGSQLVEVTFQALGGGDTFLVDKGAYQGSGGLLSGYRPEVLALVTDPAGLMLEIEARDGEKATHSLTGVSPNLSIVRRGRVCLTGRSWAQSRHFGGLQWWITIAKDSQTVEVVLNWHNGGLPASPDAYFKSVRLKASEGWRWKSELDDPVCSASEDLLVRPDDHVLPQRHERSFRILVWRDTAWEAEPKPIALGMADWSLGQYLAQGIEVPDLSHVDLNHDAVSSLLKEQTNFAGLTDPAFNSKAVSPLWPAAGPNYGGPTGSPIELYPGIRLAASGRPEYLSILKIQQLRWRSRQMGCIYKNGGVIRADSYAKDGVAPWRMFNSQFQGSPPKDEPFRFHSAQNGHTALPIGYEHPTSFDPIDWQHYNLATKHNQALAWLSGDDLAVQYLRMDAELSRMSLWEGQGEAKRYPSLTSISGLPEGQGSPWGRGDAWCANAILHAWAFSDDGWRSRFTEWVRVFVGYLGQVQMGNGYFQAAKGVKMSKGAPFNDEWYVAQSFEHLFLIHALSAATKLGGLGSLPVAAAEIVKQAAVGIYPFSWSPAGPFRIVPVKTASGVVLGENGSSAEEESGLDLSSVGLSLHRTIGPLTACWSAGAPNMARALLELLGVETVQDAHKALVGWGLVSPSKWQYSPVENWGNTLRVLQRLFA